MQTFQIARTSQSVQITMNTSGMDDDQLVEMLRRIQIEYLAKRVNFDDSILELAKEINKDWWQKNKKRLLGEHDEENRS